MVESSEYYNKDLYSIISSQEYDENEFHYLVEEILDLTSNNKLKRTVKTIRKQYPEDVEQIIRNRKDWKRFGDAANRKIKFNSIGEDTFMEYNPELLKREKTNEYINNMLRGKVKANNIKVFEGQESTLMEHIYEQAQNIPNTELNKNAMNILYYNNFKIKKTTLTLPKPGSNRRNTNGKIEEVQKAETYVPPQLRNRKRADEDESRPKEKKKEVPLEEKKSIRVSNLSIGSEEELTDWLSQYRLGNYKLFIPKDKQTGELKDYAFLNFSFHRTAEKALEKLNKQRMGYSIIMVEWSKY